jgi:hypothetical protein
MDRETLGEISTSKAAIPPRRVLRRLSVWPALLALITTAGCALPAAFTRDDHFGTPLPTNASVEEVVRRVNTNIERLQAWRSNDVRISGQSLPVHLGGQIAVERPRNFRLTAGILGMDEEADFGSNTDWFWFWVKRGNANGQPSYVYQARHEDVPNSQMLSQIPFQPDWLMEALGVVPIDAQHVTLQPEPSGQIVNLISERLSPSGQTVKKVIRVDLRRGVVLSQSLHDMDGMLIARARLDRHVLDKATGIVMPHLIALDWPKVKLQINLEIGQIDVNPTTIPPRNWEVPKKSPCYPAFDIGAMSRKQSQIAGATSARGDRAETASATVDALQGPPPDFGAPSPLAAPRRAAASVGHSSGSWPETDGSSEFSQPIQGPSASPTGAGSPYDGNPQMPASARAPASSPSRSASAADPFGESPALLGTLTPPRPTSAPPVPSSSGSNNGDPFESMPH